MAELILAELKKTKNMLGIYMGKIIWDQKPIKNDLTDF
jgi:hypothetical protein